MFIVYLILSILLLLEEYIRLSMIGFTNSYLSEEVFIGLFLITSVGYLYKCRRQNLFCFETFFLAFSFLIIFFDYLVFSTTSDTGLIGSLWGRFSDVIRIKTLYVSVLATFIFLLGSYVSDLKAQKYLLEATERIILSNKLGIKDLKYISKILTIITLLYFLYLFAIGYISSWFRYGTDSSSYVNTKIVYLTVLCLSSTVAQFSQYAGRTFSSVWEFVKHLDKFYLCVIGTVTFLLLISGNRNEALYVVLPMLVCYSILVKNITNKEFLVLFLAGFLLMVFIGFTRQTGVKNGLDEMSFNLFEFTRDFGYANIDSMYLIGETDKNGVMGFNLGIINLLSAIPFLGGISVSAFGIEEFTRSAVATSEGMGISYTGLGTSLVGDTYYTGGIIFTFIYFYLLGRLMSYLHNRYYKRKIINIYTLVIYSFMLSNAIYCLRSEWYTSFRYIGFSIILLFVFGALKIRTR